MVIKAYRNDQSTYPC